MLHELYDQQNLTCTENGALAFRSTGSACLDFFSFAGALSSADESRIRTLLLRAWAENPTDTLRILFYARDVRGGLGERRVFRVGMQTLAAVRPHLVERLLPLFAEYGRFDDLLILLDTPCSDAVSAFLLDQLKRDLEKKEQNQPVSLLAKWLPSVNASNEQTVTWAKMLCKSWHMSQREYRRALSGLRQTIDLTETRLCRQDYSFDYAGVPGKALVQYRKAFLRHDGERFNRYLEAVQRGDSAIHTQTIYPYELVHAALLLSSGTDPDLEEEEKMLETAWGKLPDYTDGRNALVVVDGSGSMYGRSSSNGVRPIDVALSLGMYFAERNTGPFHGHFITFSMHPRLVRIPEAPFADRVRFCRSFSEISNTDLYQVFMLILITAVKNHLPQEELPQTLYIISDMEFDSAVAPDKTVYEDAKEVFESYGYTLPQVVFWNVNSFQDQVPVQKDEKGTALVSGCSPVIFDLVMNDHFTPDAVMRQVLDSPRYAGITAA